jgi:ferrochelatase
MNEPVRRANQSARVGVVAMAYGTPASPDDVEAYYTHIRRGRPPSPAELADLEARYQAIGGLSPLAAQSEAQRAGLQVALDQRAPGRFEVVLGNKHAPPFIEEAVRSLAERGIRQAVGLVLTPHFARASVGHYQERAAEAGRAHGLEVRPINQWYLLPTFVAAMAAGVTDALAAVGTPPGATRVLFTAHSLPERALEGDPYPEQLRQGASAIATAARLAPRVPWSLAWQSAGRAGGPWRGPGLLDVIGELGAAGEVAGMVVCPHGFVSEHLEVRYDLDHQARQAATEAGVRFARTRVMGADAGVLGSLAEKVLAVSSGADDPMRDRP